MSLLFGKGLMRDTTGNHKQLTRLEHDLAIGQTEVRRVFDLLVGRASF